VDTPCADWTCGNYIEGRKSGGLVTTTVAFQHSKWGVVMFKFIEGLPQDVLAIAAVGKVTHEDYRDTLVPKAESMMAQGPIKLFYVIGKEFTGFELEALWDDAVLGVKHWHDFSQIAVVTNHAWLRAAVSMFKPFFHGEVRVCTENLNPDVVMVKSAKDRA
jgi:hypothetical protein